MAGDTPNQGDSKPIDVHEALASTVDFFAMLAWQKMGLQPDMGTGQLATNMAQAKAAVDAVSCLANILEPSLEDSNDKRQIQNLVRDLKVNYVEKAEASK